MGFEHNPFLLLILTVFFFKLLKPLEKHYVGNKVFSCICI